MRAILFTSLAIVGACGPGRSAPPDDVGTDTTSADETGSDVGGTTTVGPSTTQGTESGDATTSAAADDAYEEDSGGTGCAFTCPGTGGGGGGGGGAFECDVFAQDCPEGEKCMPWANDGGAVWNATRCSPLDPDPNEPGEPCTVEGSGVSGIDDCGLGQMCWDVDPKTNTGVCVGLCLGTSFDPICPRGEACLEVSAVISRCVPSCDRLVQDCGPMQACANEIGDAVCMPAGTADEGEDCSAEPCSAGNVCIDGDAVVDCTNLACCTSYCDPTAPQCPQAATCEPLPDTRDVGLCVAT